jgi:hypothetical protein
VAAIGSFKTQLCFSCLVVAKLETGRAPLVERGGPLVGKVGEWCVESRHLQGCSPRLCWLRTDGLAHASKY